MKFKYFKKWKDHPAKLEAEGEPIGWFEVTYEEVEKRLDGCFKDIDLVFETLHEGHTVNTPFSLFKAEKDLGKGGDLTA
jgi:hypothetical protein